MRSIVENFFVERLYSHIDYKKEGIKKEKDKGKFDPSARDNRFS